MLQDVLRGAPTEIDAICGAVVETGQKHGIDTPINWACWKLVKAIVG
jgi:2-dehydropantoate 2-reductase